MGNKSQGNSNGKKKFSPKQLLVYAVGILAAGFLTFIMPERDTESNSNNSVIESMETGGESSTLFLDSASNPNTAKEADISSENNTSDTIEVMDIHFIDIGQGDSTLIINGEYTMLIDAGENNQGVVVREYLQNQGVDQIDYLILTHTDSDHIGGADVVIDSFDIDTVFMGDFEKDTKTYRDVLTSLDNKDLSWSTPEAGDTFTLGDANVTIIAPNRDYDDANDTSIGLILEKGEIRAVFTGDAEEEAEADIVSNGIDISADIYHAGHHGSRTSSSIEILDAIRPVYAVISCETDNSYGHPHAQTLNRLRERGIQVFRTDEQGSLIASINGQTIKWNSAPSDTWQAGEPTGSSSSNSNENTSSQKVDYVCNTSTKKFHLTSCSSVETIKEDKKMEITTTREDMISQGYTACKSCNP